MRIAGIGTIDEYSNDRKLIRFWRLEKVSFPLTEKQVDELIRESKKHGSYTKHDIPFEEGKEVSDVE